MKNLWTEKEAKLFSKNRLSMRVYSSRLLGRNPELVLHGGGNTSVKGHYKNIFNERIETLFIKGSGWDLVSIQEDGFAPVDLNHLLSLAGLESLSDKQMVIQQRLATLKPSAPNPSVEAILHALIPYTFVDHTHADAVLAVTNSLDGRKKINDIYGSDILVVPYVMPGFILAKKIEKMTKNIDWSTLRGMILMNHGVFSFGDNAKESYDRMIQIVSKSEEYLKKEKVFRKYNKSSSKADLLLLANIRRKASQLADKPCLALLNDSSEAVGFSKLKEAKRLSLKGTLTPDHVIRTKPFAFVINGNLDKSVKEFENRYNRYFQKYKSKGLEQLDNGPKWALWPGFGTISFGSSIKEASIVYDINEHTIRAMQTSHNLDKWKPISFRDLFDVEYWSLEQAKIKKKKKLLEGNVVVVTGGTGTIGFETYKIFKSYGAEVVLLDYNLKRLNEVQSKIKDLCIHCDVTNKTSVKNAFKKICEKFGGFDILISNAGAAPGGAIGDVSDDILRKSFEINFFSHQNCASEAIKIMKKQNTNGCLLFNISKQSVNPGKNFGPYGLPKSALLSLCKQYAVDYGSCGIRSNGVNADRIKSGLMTEKMIKTRAKARSVTTDTYMRGNLLSNEVKAEDVAKAFFHLAVSKKTTGAVLTVDGGNIAASLR